MRNKYSTWSSDKKDDSHKAWRKELLGRSREGIAEEAEEIRNMLCSDGGIFLGRFFPERVTTTKTRHNPSGFSTPPDDE